jgi:hypothetical protein
MNSHNNGKGYELLVKYVYEGLCSDERFTEVKHNVMLPGPDGDRQIDVLVIHTHASTEYKTVIECRDYSGKLSVTHIDGFASKIIDVHANKGIIVSRNGFSRTAIQKARRLGIELCTVNSADKLLKELVVEIPVVVLLEEIAINVTFLAKNTNERSVKILSKNTTTVNDIPLRDLLVDELKSGSIQTPKKGITFSWSPTGLTEPYFFRAAGGEKIELAALNVQVQLAPTFLFGKTSDLPDFISHTKDGDPVARVVVPPDFRVGLNESFSVFKHLDDVPASADSVIRCVVIPDVDSAKAPETKLWLFTPSQGRRAVGWAECNEAQQFTLNRK